MLSRDNDTQVVGYCGHLCHGIGCAEWLHGHSNNGVQADGTPAHDVLFSMWDDGSTDEDPNLPEYMRAGVVDCDSLTITNRFGNEGTGVQTYRRGDCWIPGRFVQFITNARREQTSYTTIENGKEVEHKQNNILVSAWYNAQDGKGWQYMATVRKRNSTDLFSSWYSFLEIIIGPRAKLRERLTIAMALPDMQRKVFGITLTA